MKTTPDRFPERRAETLEEQLRRQARSLPAPHANALRRRVMDDILRAPVPARQTGFDTSRMLALAAILLALLGGGWWIASVKSTGREPISLPHLGLWSDSIPFEPSMIERPLAQEASALKNDLATASRHLLSCAGIDG